MPQFQSPGAAAGNALEEFLMQQETLKRQAMLDALLKQQKDAEIRQQEEAIKLRLGDQDLERQREARIGAQQTQVNDLAMADRRQDQNKDAVRSMAMEAFRIGSANPGQARQMAFGEGVDIPMDVLDPDRDSRMQGERDKRLHGYDMDEIAAQGEQSRRTVAANQRAQAPTGQPSAYASDTARRTIQAIDDVLPKIDNTTAGILGNLGAKTGLYQPAVNVSAELSSVAANVAFNALQAMREASKTGGALGQVSERELDLLSAVEGSIRQNQSPENLKIQLGKIRESMTRFELAAQGNAQPMPSHGGVVKWGKDANGRPVRIQ